MANGKNIEVRIAATGGSEAAAEVRKVESAVENLEDSTSGGSKGIDELNQQLDEMRARAEALKQETIEVAKEQESANQAMRLGRSAAIGLGIGGAVVAKTFQEISKGLASIDIENLKQIDPAAAAQVEGLNELTAALQNPVAALQKLISGSTIGEAFAAMNEQISLNVQAQEAAVNRLTSASREMAARLGETAKEIAAANAVLNAKDSADAAERDAADAARVRAGEAPEDVRVDRAAFNRDRELEKINRGIEPLANRTQAAFDYKQQAFGDANRVLALPGVTAEQGGKAALAAAYAASDFEKAKAEYENALAIAIEQRRGVRARFEAETGDAAGDKAARLAREQQQAEREQQRAAAQARRAELEAQREAQRTALAGTAAGNEARVRNAPASQSNRLLQDLAGDIGNADSEAEIAALGAKITASQGQLSAAMVNSLRQILTQQEAMVQQIAALEANIKNTRGK